MITRLMAMLHQSPPIPKANVIIGMIIKIILQNKQQEDQEVSRILKIYNIITCIIFYLCFMLCSHGVLTLLKIILNNAFRFGSWYE